MQIICDRIALHRIPELGMELPKTMAYLKKTLSGLGCTLFSPIESSLCAYFDFGREKTLAFRADCDALPVCERNTISYVSTHPGVMHACGHDGHMAILLDLARRLSEKRELPHNVLLIFQPGEETPGGAAPICRTGVLEKYHVEAIFGLHLWPGLERGWIFSRERELMARASEVTVDITGRSAHLAKSREGLDALAAGAEFYRRVAQAEAAYPDSVYRLLKFGRFQSGTARNAVSAHTHMEGTLRAFQDEVFEGLKRSLYDIAAQVEAEFGVQVAIHMSEGYPAVMNPPELMSRLRQVAQFTELPEPCMTAEDFAWYQKYVPGAFFFLGLGDTPPLHSDNFDFDMNVLTTGAEFFEHLAEKFV